MSFKIKPSLQWLLVFLPVAVALHYLLPREEALIFVTACLAIIPLAGLLGNATEHLASRAGSGIGALLNATFGNAAELIIGLMALREGLFDVVKASLTGSIIGNLLLVLGMAFVACGLKHKVQHFNTIAASTYSTTLMLAAIALILPAVFHYVSGPVSIRKEADLSTEISFVLIITYILGLVFSLRTHRHLFGGGTDDQEPGETETAWPVHKAIGLLILATLLTAWVSEILVGSVEGAAKTLGMNDIFIGVVVVAIIGNAAEHSTAVVTAVKDKMDLSVGIAIGSSVQIALFVAPALVLLSYLVAPTPMNLVFSPAEVIAIGLSILITAQVTSDGESNWL